MSTHFGAVGTEAGMDTVRKAKRVRARGRERRVTSMAREIASVREATERELCALSEYLDAVHASERMDELVRVADAL
jgi:hypothetical protein